MNLSFSFFLPSIFKITTRIFFTRVQNLSGNTTEKKFWKNFLPLNDLGANEFSCLICIFLIWQSISVFVLLTFTFFKIKTCKFYSVFLKAVYIYSSIFIKKYPPLNYWFDYILYHSHIFSNIIKNNFSYNQIKIIKVRPQFLPVTWNP